MPFAARLDNRALLAVSGPEARAFLQGLLSNDMEKAAPDRAIYAALLTAQGKFLHDVFVAVSGDTFLLDCEAARRDDLKRRLTLYRLRAKVAITEDVRGIWALWGDGTPKQLGLAERPGTAAEWAGGIVYTDPRLPALGARAIGDSAPEGFDGAEASAYDRHRLALGVPDGSKDMEIEKAILLESSFEELNGVDFQKGCYVGQELTARTKHRGLVKKRLVPVSLDGAPPAPGTPVTSDGKDAGTFFSANGTLGMALLRLEAIHAAAHLSAGGARLTPHVPGWMKLPE